MMRTCDMLALYPVLFVHLALVVATAIVFVCRLICRKSLHLHVVHFSFTGFINKSDRIIASLSHRNLCYTIRL